MKRTNKKGQITIFILLALMIIALGIVIYLFLPKIQSLLGFGSENPNEFLQKCIEDELKDSIEIVSLKGGSSNASLTYLYKDEEIEYLCYNENYYERCIMQQPMLKDHIEDEIKILIKKKVNECVNSMEENFKNKGYQVVLNRGDFNVELLPEKIVVVIEDSLTLTKENSESYSKFVVSVNNNLYELISIANSILNWEARYGDAESTVYMNYYHDLKVEKLKQTEGTTIYILTNRNTKDKFQFASRSVAWPAGYGTSEVLK